MDNGYTGYRAALWLLGLFIAVKLAMSLNSIFNTAAVAQGADRIPLDTFEPEAARTVLTLFALMMLGQLALALIALVTLIRYRTLVPFVYLVLLGEQLARRIIVSGSVLPRAGDASAAFYVNCGLLTLLTAGLVL